MVQNKTIDYYNLNAQSFYDRTINTDLSITYKEFLSLLPKGAHILDAGCGVGRDSKYFLKNGYQVTAFDASKEMVLLASKESGLNVIKTSFQEIDFDQVFDAVWAQFSLIHIAYDETGLVYKNIYRALKPKAIFFASYKYGHGHMPTLERDFWNMDEKTVKLFLNDMFDIVKIWIEEDTRSKTAPSKAGKILNFIARKKS